MNIATIRAELTATLDAQAQLKGETADLNPEDNTEVTDALAAALDDLNPNHQYPSVNK